MKSPINIMSGRILRVAMQLLIRKREMTNVRFKNRTKADTQKRGCGSSAVSLTTPHTQDPRLFRSGIDSRIRMKNPINILAGGILPFPMQLLSRKRQVKDCRSEKPEESGNATRRFQSIDESASVTSPVVVCRIEAFSLRCDSTSGPLRRNMDQTGQERVAVRETGTEAQSRSSDEKSTLEGWFTRSPRTGAVESSSGPTCATCRRACRPRRRSNES
jgi:hypothetical protein